jgi:hypothetical protein
MVTSVMFYIASRAWRASGGAKAAVWSQQGPRVNVHRTACPREVGATAYRSRAACLAVTPRPFCSARGWFCDLDGD